MGGSTSDDSTDESTGALGETSAETGEPATTSTGEAENAAPQIFAFAASPDEIFEAGEVKLELEASDDVVEVDVWYGDVLLATVPVEAFPYSFDVTSQAVCEGSQSFTATVRDAEAQRRVHVEVTLVDGSEDLVDVREHSRAGRQSSRPDETRTRRACTQLMIVFSHKRRRSSRASAHDYPIESSDAHPSPEESMSVILTDGGTEYGWNHR
jgi:hypothetical protein